MAVLNELEPKEVFRFFEEISAIPRGSRDTKRISDFFLMYAVMSTDSLCRCQLRTPPVVPACPSHITSLYGPDQYSDPHPCTSLDLPHHITVSMSAPWHFLLWHICSTHRLLMRISDGCQDSLRPSRHSENFAFGSLLSFVFLQMCHNKKCQGADIETVM